jgi:diguanylate cyclase (GGDEF)-like protein
VDRLSQAVLRLGRQFSTVGVIHLDVDRFKVINDSLGHPVGDQLLVAMGARLSTLVRPGDTLARVGGDDFVVLCEGLSGQTEAVTITGRICDRGPFGGLRRDHAGKGDRAARHRGRPAHLTRQR